MKRKAIIPIVLTSLFCLITASLFISTTDTNANTNGTTLTIKIHQIRELDEIEGHWGQNGADWYYEIYIFDGGNLFGNLYETGIIEAPIGEDDPILNNIHYFTVYEDDVLIFIKLMENDDLLSDFDFGNGDDLADISGSPGGGAHDTTSQLDGALYIGYYNLLNNSLWGDKTSRVSSQGEIYYYTSGHMPPDSSINTDENDAAILFAISDYYSEPEDDIDMLIVTNKDKLFDQYGNAAQDIINKIEDVAAQQNGVILDTTFDKPYAISAQIKAKAKQYTGLKYLMIVGGEKIIPFRHVKDPAGYEESIRSDYFYGDVNDNGEVNLAIGRIVGNDINDMIALLDRSAQEYNGLDTTVGGETTIGINSAHNWSKLLIDTGFVVDELYGSSYLVYLPDYLQDKALISHIGHANWYVWASGFTKTYLEATDVQWKGLGNTYPIVHTVGCYAGKIFDNWYVNEWTSIALAFIDKGAVAYIGGTGLQPQMSSCIVGEKFLKYLLAGEDIGTSLKNAKNDALSESNSINIKKVVYQHTLYGNPKFKLDFVPKPMDKSVKLDYSTPVTSLFWEPASSFVYRLNTDINITNYTITRLTEGYDLIRIPYEGFLMKEGEYMLPSLSESILLPYGAELYSATLSSYQTTSLPGTYSLPIYQSENWDGDTTQCKTVVNNKNVNFSYNISAIENPNGTKTIVIQLSPFSYNSTTGQLSLHNDFNFTIEYLISNIQLDDLIITTPHIEVGQEISILSDIENTGPPLTNLTIETKVESTTFEDFVDFSANYTSVYDFINFAQDYRLTTSFDEGGDYVAITTLKDASGHTLDVKYGNFRVMEEPKIKISDIFLAKHSNITNKVSSGTPFNLVSFVDNNGDYNATTVVAELSVPSGIDIQDSQSKMINDGTLPGFDTGYAEWVLLADTPGNYTVSVDISSDNGGTDSKIYNITVSQSTITQPEFKVEPAVQSVSQGDTFCVQLHANSHGQAVWAINFQLAYPPSFTLTGFTPYKLLGSSALEVGIPITPNSTGMIDYAQALPTGAIPLAINGSIATLCFTAPSTLGTYTLDLYDITLLDELRNPLMDVVETDATITVNTSITEETTVWISPSTLIGDIGDSFTVDIIVDPAEAIAGIQTDIQFDPTFLTATSVTDGGMFNMWYPPQLHIDNANGEIRNITAFETSGSVSTEGVLATLHFTAKMLSGTSNIDFINVIVGNPEGEVVPVTLMPGEVALYGDTFPPVSSVNTITPYSYHIGEMPLPLTASASDIGSGVKEVSLYYRYSTDNTTWTDWIEYGTKMSSSYTWFFTAPHGPGYYEFYSQATDNADNMEAEPLGADAFCRIYPEWDMNMDERVNILDIIIIGQQWGKTGSPGWILMDANSDGVVNILDLILVSQHWTG